MDAYQNLISGDKPPRGVQGSCSGWFDCIIAYSLPIFNLKILLRTPTALTMVLAKLVFLFLWSVQFIVILKQLSGIILDSAGG